MWSGYLAWLARIANGHILLMKISAFIAISVLSGIIYKLNATDAIDLASVKQMLAARINAKVQSLWFILYQTNNKLLSALRAKWQNPQQARSLPNNDTTADPKLYAQNLALAEAYLDLRDVAKAKKQLETLRAFNTPEVAALKARFQQLINNSVY